MRYYGKLDVTPDIPEEVKEFANQAADVWQPDEVYVVDICESQGSLKIIEINGFNSTGFYASDIHKITKAVTEAAKCRET